MPIRRTLSLKREVLQELADNDLQVVGAAGTIPDTMYSCLAYVSCDLLRCVVENTLVCVN
jgi:hypothetical protein